MSFLSPSASSTAPIDYSDERAVRLLLSRLVEPEDHLFTELRESAVPALSEPAELLRAVIDDRASPPRPWPAGLAERLESRRAGIGLKLACADPEADFEAGAAAEARFLIPGDADWPSGLDDLGGRAPFGIWIIGRFEPRAPAVAMVGARACTGYGSLAAGQLAADLARAGTTIVSGAALGVDGAAHRGALAVGGTTVAVLACGIDRSYPASHRTLIQAIGERGAVLAELPPGTSPTRFRFLARNRLIAALGLGTIVVEAAGRSGSLVTARLAAELGRAVFAVPGPVTSRQSLGTNQLLCDGAIPAVDAPQILAELGVESARPSASPRQTAEVNTRRADTPSGSASDAVPLDPHAVLVREALPTARSGRAAEVLTLATATGLAPPQVLALLGQLAAGGQVVKTGSGWALR